MSVVSQLWSRNTENAFPDPPHQPQLLGRHCRLHGEVSQEFCLTYWHGLTFYHHKTKGCQHINLIVTQMEFNIYVTTKSILSLVPCCLWSRDILKMSSIFIMPGWSPSSLLVLTSLSGGLTGSWRLTNSCRRWVSFQVAIKAITTTLPLHCVSHSHLSSII